MTVSLDLTAAVVFPARPALRASAVLVGAQDCLVWLVCLALQVCVLRYPCVYMLL